MTCNCDHFVFKSVILDQQNTKQETKKTKQLNPKFLIDGRQIRKSITKYL